MPIVRPFILSVAAASALALAAGAAGAQQSDGQAVKKFDDGRRASGPMISRVVQMPKPGQGCKLSLTTVWAESSAGDYVIEASSSGRACNTATLKIDIRRPDSARIYRASHDAASVYGFPEIGADDVLAMRGRMIDWATNYGRAYSTAQLPDWPDWTPSPITPPNRLFLVADDLEQPAYEAARAADRPMFCYMATLAHMRCVTVTADGSKIITLGDQQFRDE